MKKKTASRARTTRVAPKAKRAKTKARKAVAGKATSRKKPSAKKAPAGGGAKPKARRGTTPPSVGAWPGLPPGYFDRSR